MKKLRGRPRADRDRKARYKSIVIKTELKDQIDAAVKNKNMKNITELLKYFIDRG